MAIDQTTILIQEWDRAKAGALEYIDAMPEEKGDFRPVPEVLTFTGQFLHIADANLMFATAAFGNGEPSRGAHSELKPELQSRAAMRPFVAASYDAIINGLQALPPDSLDVEISFFKFTMPRHVMLAKAMEHHAHHRGQTAIYFRLQGMQPPPERLFQKA